MVRKCASLAVLAVSACSITNPLFAVEVDGTGSSGAETGLAGSTGEPTGGVSETGPATSEASETGESTGPEPARCGDAVVESTEQCDDGNTDDSDACLGGCVNARCGDGALWAGHEVCDDGNTRDGDDCPATCLSLSCGDGVLDEDRGEQCDDGNEVDNDGCSGLCLLPVCGDGIPQQPEQCDDGNASDADGCSKDCELVLCGDGVVTGAEACDDGASNGTPGECNNTCSGVDPFCGDGVIDGFETCDDGNNTPDDGCDMCVADTCGNGVVDPGEDCDDGNGMQGDDCSNQCKYPGCGDGFQAEDEKCDDGDADNTDECTSTCTPAFCGDGFTWAGTEACDDGNGEDHDGCLNSCQKAVCGDGVTWEGVEACDDGNVNLGDGCADCLLEQQVVCGDGVLGPDEECDPGMAPFKELGLLCKDDCTLGGCFRFHNDKLKNVGSAALAANDWLTECTEVAGQTVAVVLLDDAKKVVYAAKGSRGAADWVPLDLTMGQAKPAAEYNVKNHLRLVKMNHIVPDDGKQDVLMLTGKIATPGQPDCQGGLGDGYGIAVFPLVNDAMSARMLVMGASGGATGAARKIVGFKPSTEISYKGDLMNVCDGGVTGFGGTFILYIF